MDKLSIVKAIFEHTILNNTTFSAQADNDGIKGYGIGFKNEKSKKARKNESYAIVLIIDPETPSDQVKSLPKKMNVLKQDIPELAIQSNLPEKISVHVRYEKKRPHFLATGSTHVINALATATLSGGDPLFVNGILIGTAGYIFSIDGALHLVSNKHVLAAAGEGNLVTNQGGVPLAKVTQINPDVDSATAILEQDIAISKTIPGIGTPSGIGSGLELNMIGKKRGTSTQVTTFRIKWSGPYSGILTSIGTHVDGATVPSVGSGDSGSIVIGSDNSVTSLVYAGATVIGEGPNGDLYSEIWAMDINQAFTNIQLP